MRIWTKGIGRPARTRTGSLRSTSQSRHVRTQVRERQDRAGLRHSVAGDHVDSAVDGLAREGQRERRAADDHLPSREDDLRAGALRGLFALGRPGGLTPSAAGLPSSIDRIVGTQWENVTPSRATSASSLSGT